ncbi:MAG: hypothetical protein Q4C49_13765 [Bacillota bacterium]|nr:hypothetical protein [Bacillota bacterium]
MEWTKLKEQYVEVLKKELEETEPTIKAYQYLIDQGYDSEQAIDTLAVYYHMMTMNLLEKKKEYEESEWDTILKPIYQKRDGKKINKGQMSSLLRRIEKEIGKIEQGNEEEYLDGLMFYESQALNFSQYYGLHTNELAYVLKAWTIKLYADYKNENYDLLKCMDAELNEMAYLLEKDGNPYSNGALAETMMKEDSELDLNDPEVKKMFFSSAIQCLQRIIMSIDFWNKQLGYDGYIKYLKNVFLKEEK